MAHTLLLADDSLAIQRVVELTFAREDVRVIAVGDGRQAMDRLVAERPDIVLADIAMPLADGYDVAAFVRASPALRHVPVLLLAGAFDTVEPARLDASGARGVLVKPFEPHAMISRVKELLGMTPSGEAAPAGSGRLVTPAEPLRPPRTLTTGAPDAAAPAPAVPALDAAPLDAASLDALVDRVASRLLEQWGERLHADVARRVLDVSERLVREEIARLREAADGDGTHGDDDAGRDS